MNNRLTRIAALAVAIALPSAVKADGLADAVRTTLSATYVLQMYQADSPLKYGTPEWDSAFDQSLSGVLKVLPKDCTAETFRITLCGLRINTGGSSSMAPAVEAGEFIFSLPYTNTAPIRRGDIVLFRANLGGSNVNYIKRAVGLPGETVELKAGTVFVNDKPLNLTPAEGELNTDLPDSYPLFRETTPEGRSYLIARRPDSEAMSAENAGPYTVPADSLFVLGDNRHNSLDSRFGPELSGFGFVSLPTVIGQSVLVYISKNPARNGTVLIAD